MEIIGILKLSSRICINHNGCNVKPLISNYLGTIYAKCKSSKDHEDMYVRARVENTEVLVKIAEVIETIGKVSCLESTCKYILLTHKINSNYYIRKNQEILVNRVDLTHLDIISIDPLGCTDIDDSLHFIKTNTGYQIGIHIADVNTYMLDFSKNKYFSIYTSNKISHLLSNNLRKICSLTSGDTKNALSLILDYNNSHNIINIQILRTKIKIRKNYDYDDVNIFDDNLVRNLYDHYKNQIGTTIDPVDLHKMIEYYMVQYNSILTRKLYPEYQNLILRISDEKEKYQIRANFHEKAYAHFTSPLRRFVDIINQQILINHITPVNSSETQIMIDNNILHVINYMEKHIKLATREINILRKLYDQNGKETQGTITKINNKKISLYLQDYDIIYKHKIFPDELDPYVIYSIDENNYSVQDKQTGKILKLKLNQIITVKIIVCRYESNFHNKIKIMYVNPDQNIFYNLLK